MKYQVQGLLCLVLLCLLYYYLCNVTYALYKLVAMRVSLIDSPHSITKCSISLWDGVAWASVTSN